jgi:hypothetical protein
MAGLDAQEQDDARRAHAELMLVLTIADTDGPMAGGEALADVADLGMVAAMAVGLLASAIEVIAHYRGETTEQIRHQMALLGQTAPLNLP